MRLKSALRRGVAAAVIAGIVVSSGIPAYAKTWDIADGDITVKGASDESGNYNNVKQGEKDFEKDEGETVITGESKEHTVTIDTSEGNVDVTFDDLKIDVSGKTEVDGSGKTEVDSSGDSPVDAGKAAVTVQGDHDAAIELDGDNELKSGSHNAGLEKNGNESSGKLTIKDDNDTKGSLTAEGGKDGAGIGGGYESGAGNIEITGGTVEAVGGEGAAGIGGGVYGPGRDIEISGGKVSATGGSYSGDPRPGAAGIGDGAGAWSEIDPDAPPSNPNHIYISGDAEVEAKAGASTGGKTAAIGGIVGEIPNDALSDDDHKVTGGSLTRYDPDGKKMEDYSYDRRTPSQPEQPDKPEQPDDTENDEDDDEDDAPSVQTGEVPDRVKQMYETVGVITHLDGTQELGNVATAEYDPVNKVLSFDAHSTLFRMTGDSLRELAKEVHELRIRFLDGEGREMEAVIPLARIKDLVGVNGAFELELSHEGLSRFHVVGQTGYDRKTFSDETVLRQSGKELILVYRVGDEEQKAQETARVEEAIARRKQEKKQWGTVLSGLEGGSLSGLPELTQPGTGTVGGVTDFSAAPKDPTILDMGPITVRPSEQPASEPTVWKTFTSNIVKLVGGKQDSKKDDPAPSVGDLSGPTTLSPDSLTTVQQPEISTQQPETSTQQPETGGWVTDSQGDWVWKPGKDDSQPPDLRGDWETRKWIRDSQPPDLRGDWETRKWVRVSQSPDLAWWNSFYDSIRKYDYEG
ncbi:hypothetical protein DWZ46_04300 [Faecalibacterium prausnitzii]|uniref:Uncharacterized protein n=1 Tax=Faecalibacterium prausnitzii TaxID=853 RepID=A0A3E2U9I9_9FIRM|nr:hypothetical protein [Faecalibacterium prausnitzii]RGB92886.1 hypothetical protein DWZ46_04300 [Faecalibacterium prausnitzii]